MDIVKTRKFALLSIAVLGILTCIELFYLYWQANYNPYALSSFCSINDVIDCDGIEKSMLAQVFGIPFAVWGMLIYSSIIFFLYVDKLKDFKYLKFLEVFKNPRMYIAAIGYIAFTLSLILAATAYVQIKKICILCALTYVFDISIGLIATDFKNGGIINVFKTSVDDLIAGVKIKKYGISFGVCCLLVAGFLSYTTSSFVFVPHLKKQREFNYFKGLVEKNPYKLQGNVYGDKNPKVKIILFTDYECPMCKIYNVMLNKAMRDVKGVQIIHKNFPLDKNCNKIIDSDFHENACMYAKYSVAAEEQGKWGEMNDVLFKNQPKTEDEIINLAKSLDLNTELLKETANSEETLNYIKSDIDEALEYKVNGTPTLIINGETYAGIRPYDELKKLLKDAKSKK